MKRKQYMMICMAAAMAAASSLPAGAALKAGCSASKTKGEQTVTEKTVTSAEAAETLSGMSSGLKLPQNSIFETARNHKTSADYKNTSGSSNAASARQETSDNAPPARQESSHSPDTSSEGAQSEYSNTDDRSGSASGTEVSPAAIAVALDALDRMVNPLHNIDDLQYENIDPSDLETKADTGAETEADTESDTESDTGMESESGSGQDKADVEILDLARASSPIIGETEAEEDETEAEPEDVLTDKGPSHSRHDLFSEPDIDDYNPARVSLYDYRMLREYPLSTLPRDLHALYYLLRDKVAKYDGTWSVYVEDLSTRQALVVGDRKMKSASVMKLFIMAAVYDQIDSGRLDRTDEVVSLLHDMISHSSNEAANRLLKKLGQDDYSRGVKAVNNYISAHGYSAETHEYNGFEDDSAIVDGSHFNQIGAKDVGLLLERVYSRDFISRKVCNEIEDMMLSQETRYKIPKGLPDGVEVANKTGEMDTVENDAALVYGEKTDFILVVLSEDWDSKDKAQENIQEIAGLTYDYLN